MLNEERFDAPIPGMALTAEAGNRPWQKPPRYANTKDVVGEASKRSGCGTL